MAQNPYTSSRTVHEVTGDRQRFGAPIASLVVFAAVLGGVMNLAGWLLARNELFAPRRAVFAPLVIAGLQDISDLLLGVASGAILFAAYAAGITSARNCTRVLIAFLIVLFHAACIACIETRMAVNSF